MDYNVIPKAEKFYKERKISGRIKSKTKRKINHTKYNYIIHSNATNN